MARVFGWLYTVGGPALSVFFAIAERDAHYLWGIVAAVIGVVLTAVSPKKGQGFGAFLCAVLLWVWVGAGVHTGRWFSIHIPKPLTSALLIYIGTALCFSITDAWVLEETEDPLITPNKNPQLKTVHSLRDR